MFSLPHLIVLISHKSFYLDFYEDENKTTFENID